MFAALMVSAAGCSTSSVLNTDKVEEQIRKHVESTYQTRAQEAACPERPARNAPPRVGTCSSARPASRSRSCASG